EYAALRRLYPPRSADLDGRVLRTEPSHGRHALVTCGQRVRAQDTHRAALRDVVPQLFELNGRFDVPVRPDGGRAFTTGRDLGGLIASARRGRCQPFFSGVPELRRVRAAIDHHLREQLVDAHRYITPLSN